MHTSRDKSRFVRGGLGLWKQLDLKGKALAHAQGELAAATSKLAEVSVDKTILNGEVTEA
jgi:hypothetical protein